MGGVFKFMANQNVALKSRDMADRGETGSVSRRATPLALREARGAVLSRSLCQLLRKGFKNRRLARNKRQHYSNFVTNNIYFVSLFRVPPRLLDGCLPGVFVFIQCFVFKSGTSRLRY